MSEFMTFFSNHPVLVGIWLILLFLLVSTTVKAKLSKVAQVSPQELTMLVNRQDGVVLDIRAEKDFKAGHIVDAKSLPIEQAKEGNFSALEKYKTKPIIVACYAGVSAVGIANKLSQAGFAQVSVLQGGMNAWTGANLPIVKK